MKNVITSLSILLLFSNLFGQALSPILPANNISIEETMVEFVWNKSSNTDELYILEISTDSSFNTLLVDSILDQNNLTIDLSSFQNTHLYWRVKDSLDNYYSELRHLVLLDLDAFSGLDVWVKSDSVLSINDTLQEWYNLGNPAFTLTQSSDSRKPLMSGNYINGYEGVSFVNGKELKGIQNIHSNVGLELYSVTYSSYTGVDFKFIYDQGFLSSKGAGVALTANAARAYLPFSHGGLSINIPISTIEYSMLNVSTDFSNSNIHFEQNKNLDSVIAHSVNNFSSSTINSSFKFTLGGQAKSYSSGRTFIGDMYEVIILKDTVFANDLDRSIIPNYLRNKYAPYPNLGLDIKPYSLCQTEYVLYPGNDYETYLWNTSSIDSSILVNESDDYYIETHDIFGNIEYDTIEVTLPFQYLEDTLKICYQDSILLDVGLGSNYMFDWSNGSNDSMIYANQPGMYIIEATDTFGCSIIDTTYVVVDSFSFSPTLGPDRTFCLNTELGIENIDAGSFSLNYQWSTLESTPSIILSYNADTTIFVEVTNNNSCVFRDTIQANVNSIESPIVDFIADTACLGTQSVLQSSAIPFGNDEISNYLWTFPDASTGGGFINSDYQHVNTNSFFVRLTVETDSSCVNSIEKEVYINSAPQANFVADIQCFKQETNFFDESIYSNSDSIVAWNWTFNGTDNSNSQNPISTLDSLGLNQVKLVVQDVNSCTDSITKAVEVFPELIAEFGVDNICIGDTIQFTDTSPSFSVIDRTWDFDYFNQGSSMENPNFYYPNPGIYNVKLSITNAIGCISDTTKSIEVRELPQLDVYNDNACEGIANSFIDLSSTNNGVISNQIWNIEGATFNSDTVYYSFDEVGDYQVSLEVFDNFLCANDTTFTVSVLPLPIADFDFFPNYGEAPIDIQFTNLSSPDAIDFLWSFGDNSANSIDENPLNTYSQNGVYDIVLVASTLEGCFDSLTQSISIIPTELDIELSNLSIQKISLGNGSIGYQPSVLIKNVGTRTIFNADLFLSINNETQIAETWEGVLFVGQSILFELNNFAVINTESQVDYICLEAQNVNDNTELNFTNNKICLIQNGSLRTSNLYPNPAQDIVQLDVIMEQDGSAQIGVFDMIGKSIIPMKELDLVTGYNLVSINTSSLQAGKYVVNIIYQDEVIPYSLIIHNQ